LRKGLSIFLFLSAVVCGAVLFFSIDRKSFIIFKKADALKMYLAFMFVVCVWLLDAAKMCFLLRAAGEKVNFTTSLELTWINYFGAAITPMQSGGGPLQMYVMYQHGVSVGKSVAVTIIRTVLVMLILGAMIPFAIMMKGTLPKMGWGARGLIFYVVVFILAIWLGLVVSVVKPSLVKRLAARIISFLKKAGLLKAEWEARLLKLSVREIDAYNENVRAFLTTGRRYFLLGVFAAFVQILFQLSVMPCMIWALGFPVSYPECVLLQAVFLFVLYFIPTPGGSGAAEGGAAFVFSMFVPWNVAGMLGIGWRFITEYTGIFLGAIVAVRRIGWSLANQIMSKKDCAGRKDSVGKEPGSGAD
jgi:uncharacterized protein (TIRG00374 family)